MEYEKHEKRKVALGKARGACLFRKNRLKRFLLIIVDLTMMEQEKKTLSCGIIMESPEGVLLGHATNTKRWDIPKGRQELNETALETAIRELEEETGITLEPHWVSACVDLGKHEYIREKDLHLFYLSVPHAFPLDRLRCRTFVERNGGTYLEMDQYAWIPYGQLNDYAGRSLVYLFQKLRPQMQASNARGSHDFSFP